MSVCAIRPLLNGAWSPSSMSGMSRSLGHRQRSRARRRRRPRAAARAAKRSAGERREPVHGRAEVALERDGLVVAEHELAAGGGGALGDDVHRRRLDLGEEHVGLGGGARHGAGQPPPVGEVARDEHDLGAVVRRRATRASRGAAASGAVVKKATRRPRTGCAGRGRNTVGTTCEAGLDAPLAAAASAATSPGVGERRLALRQHERVAEQQPVGAEEAGDVVGRLARPGDAERGVGRPPAAPRRRCPRSPPARRRARRRSGSASRTLSSNGVAGQAAAAAPAADGGHAGEHRVLVAVAGGVAAGAGGGEQLGRAEPVAAAARAPARAGRRGPWRRTTTPPSARRAASSRRASQPLTAVLPTRLPVPMTAERRRGRAAARTPAAAPRCRRPRRRAPSASAALMSRNRSR